MGHHASNYPQMRQPAKGTGEGGSGSLHSIFYNKFPVNLNICSNKSLKREKQHDGAHL